MKIPIIHLYSICYNEKVLMPHFLDYYSGFCDKIHIYDNQSDDDTIKICEKYSNVSVLTFDTAGKIRDDIYLTIKNNIWKKSRGIADYVIICDIDEFLYHHDMLNFLNQIQSNNVTIVKPIGYNMVSEVLPASSNNLFEDFQYGVRSISFDKVIMFNPNLIDEINFDFGAHTCNPVGKVIYSANEFKLLHYKYLNLEYVVDRYNKMSTRLSKFNLKLNLGLHYSFSKRKIRNEFNHYLKNKINVFELK